MTHSDAPKFRITGFFLILVAFCCAPVWTVEYFINQDGSAHVYSSYIMLELLKGNPNFSEVFAFNSLSIPNSSGHWLMALLLNIFPPFVVTKIIVTLTFAGFVGSVGWLRWRVAGTEGVRTSFLIGAAIGFNWLWLCGFYNFLIGVCCLVFTVGLFNGWREKMNVWRTVVLGLLFLIAYFSHIISFGVLAGSVFLVLLSAEKQYIKRNLICFCAALLPVLPLAAIYKSVTSGAGSGFYPVWRNLANPFSPVSWLQQMRTADPFILISRKSFPFISGSSKYFAVFAPVLWILTAFVSLTVASFPVKEELSFLSKNKLVFAFLLFSCIAAAMFAPDDFGLSNGSILRERLLICGLIFFVPLFRAEKSPRLKHFAQGCMVFVVAFQTLALWNYALQTNRVAREFLSAQSAIAPDNRLASVILTENESLFNSTPAAMMNNYFGIEKTRVVWDNYEIGHYLFPVVAKNAADKRFVFDFTRSNVFAIKNSTQITDEKLSRLDAVLSENHQKIKTLIVWGKDARVEEVLTKWFEPFYENGGVRVFRHK